MRVQITIKDHLREGKLFTNRVVIFAVICILSSLVLVSRAAYLQIMNHDHFTTLSQDNRLNIAPIEPVRGLIYDRNGVVLAQNVPIYNLKITPEQVGNLKATLTALGNLVEITDADLERFNKLRRSNRPFKSIPLRFRLTDREVANFAVNRHRFPGVDIEPELTRHYPLGELMAHAVGYVGRIDEAEFQKVDQVNYDGTSHIGKTGVEKYYEDILHGQVGHQEVEINAAGRILRVVNKYPPTPGQNLHLNLDVRVQRAASEMYKENNGALVAMDPYSGAVLAMVSMPSFDPNLFVNGIDSKTYKEMTASPDQPLYNRALHGQYPPGSTIKPFLGLASLELTYPGKGANVFCPGYFMLPGDSHRYRDWKKEGHGIVDLDKAIVESCDVFFYELAANMGIDRISAFLKQFGFGARTGIDVPTEFTGLLPSREWKQRERNAGWFLGETVNIGIGQGYLLVTPLQMAVAAATMGNRGLRITPRMVNSIQDPLSHETQTLEPTKAGQVEITDPASWEKIVTAMTRVVHFYRGTAKGISNGLQYHIAGKTGTAQVFGLKQDETYKEKDVDKKLRDHALFIAFAPAGEPRIAVAAIVENGGHGGSVAAPVVRKAMDTYLLGEEPLATTLLQEP